jgi:ketosteroid isomerase-like protein
MSQENVEIVRRGYEAFDSGDLESALALFDPDVEVLMAEEPGGVSLLDLSKTYRGVEGVITFLGQMAEAWGEVHWVPERYFDAGDEVVVFIRLTAEGKSSGVAVNQSMAHLCTVRSGKLVRLETFWRRDAALKAAGLSE